MNLWMCDDKSPVLPLRDLHQICDGQPPEPKGDHSLVSQKGSNYFLRIIPNTLSKHSSIVQSTELIQFGLVSLFNNI